MIIEHKIKKLLLFFLKSNLLIALMLIHGIVTAQDLPIQGTFEKAEKNALPANWELASSGKAEVINEQMNAPIKAVKLISAKKYTTAQTIRSYPAKAGDCIMIRVTYKGLGFVRIGCQGYDANMNQSASIKYSFRARDNGWDCRSKVFEIKDPKTTSVKIFFSSSPNTSMIFSSISARKLSGKEMLFSPTANRKLWTKRTQGKNLAAGKKVTFDPKPTYALTQKGDSDETDLTDGKFASISNQLWFDRTAVAWFRAFNGATIIVDLGKVCPVNKTVIRINGGYPGNGVTFPKHLEAWVSKDGKNYYRTASLIKTKPTEDYLSDWKTFYYLPEGASANKIPYVYPFELNINADARYVAIRAPFYTPVCMVTDELAIIEAGESKQKDSSYNQVYKKKSQAIIHKTIVLKPGMDKFYIPDNVKVPNWLRLDDRRENKNGKFGYIIDVPSDIDFFEDKSYPVFTRTLVKTETLAGRKLLHFIPATSSAHLKKLLKGGKCIGPLFFLAKSKNIPQKEKYVTFITTIDGKKQHSYQVPIEIISIPKVPKLEKFTTSLAWMRQDQSAGWPGFFEAQRHLGFNTIPLFPELRSSSKYKSVWTKAKEKAFKIRLIMSPSGIMNVYNPKIKEFRCIGSKGHTSACLAYRGKYYQEMLNNITKAIATYPADYMSFDEECWWGAQLNESMECPRCQKLKESKGMSWKEYLVWAQADYLKNFKSAIAKGIGKNKMPIFGFYALSPFKTVNSALGKISFLGFKYLYPEWSDEVQPSYYGRDTRLVHNNIRRIFKAIPKVNRIIPWLTAGSGPFRGTTMRNKTEQQILEAIMNGAGGLQYFAYFSFESPLDYYYVASGLKKIAPFEKMLMKAKLLDLKGSNPDLLYTARRLDKKMLLLVGNYDKIKETKTIIKLPAGKIASIVDINKNVKIAINGNSLAIKVKANDFNFYHIQYK